MKKYDVIVIGAGPAGSTAARQCAGDGLDVLMLEKEKIPREKCCAGGLSARVIKEIGFELPEEIIERRCRGMRVVQGKRKNEVINPAPIAFMVSRPAFDAYLTEKAKEAGTEVKDGETFESLEISKESIIVKTDKDLYHANIAIGADGVYSRVARTVRPKFSKQDLRFCLTAEVPLSKSRIDEDYDGIVELHYGFIDKGYAWIFPKRENLSFGIGGKLAQAKEIRKKFADFLASKGISDNIKVKGWFIPISNFKNNCYAERIMLAGDAAGFVDCFSGEGIRFAIASGKIAAGAAIKACRRGDFSRDFLKTYQDECYTSFKNDLLQSIKMTTLFFRYPNLMLGNLLMDNNVILKYFAVMRGETSFVNFSKWLMRRLPFIIARKIFQHAQTRMNGLILRNERGESNEVYSMQK